MIVCGWEGAVPGRGGGGAGGGGGVCVWGGGKEVDAQAEGTVPEAVLAAR
jgi:hypothetical protein